MNMRSSRKLIRLLVIHVRKRCRRFYLKKSVETSDHVNQVSLVHVNSLTAAVAGCGWYLDGQRDLCWGLVVPVYWDFPLISHHLLSGCPVLLSLPVLCVFLLSMHLFCVSEIEI